MAGPLAHLLVGLVAGIVTAPPGPEPEGRRAVVQIGQCSGTLVAADGVLTGAHCLNGPVDQIVVDGIAVPVAKCERHPAYRPGLPAHDIGYCRLARASAGAIASPTQVVPVGPDRDWLVARISARSRRRWFAIRLLLGGLVVAATMIATSRWRRARR